MNEQANARRTDPETSHAAAATIRGVKLRRSQEIVLACLHYLGGRATDEQLVRHYRHTLMPAEIVPWQSESGVRTRRKELVDLGLVRNSGATALLSSGNRGIVWEVVRDDG